MATKGIITPIRDNNILNIVKPPSKKFNNLLDDKDTPKLYNKHIYNTSKKGHRRCNTIKLLIENERHKQLILNDILSEGNINLLQTEYISQHILPKKLLF